MSVKTKIGEIVLMVAGVAYPIILLALFGYFLSNGRYVYAIAIFLFFLLVCIGLFLVDSDKDK